MIDELKKNAEALIEQSKAKGADEAQVVATHTLNTQIRYEKNDFVCTSANTSQNLGLKVHVDKKRGTSSTNEVGADALADTAGRAVTLAGFSVPDEFLVGYGLDHAERYRDLPFVGVLRRSAYTRSP